MILMDNNLEYNVGWVKTDKNDNNIILDVKIQGKRKPLVNLYSPNKIILISIPTLYKKSLRLKTIS